MERVAVFDLLLKEGGKLDTSQIMDTLRVSAHTAHRVMTELYALELVDRQKEGDYYTLK
jgi:DNA-binding IclR family transcriptional regulator